MKLLLGGSPCTHWSIAQSKHRETKPEGLGWELFRNYLIAREKYRPDFFLYWYRKNKRNIVYVTINNGVSIDAKIFMAAGGRIYRRKPEEKNNGITALR